MNTTESLQRLNELTKQYLQDLNEYSEEQLSLKPNEDAWSLGQMYLHLINSALYMQLGNAEKCRNISEEAMDSAKAVPAPKTEAGEAIFKLGGFPPIRVQVPASPQYTPSQADSKQQLIDGMQAVLQRARELQPLLEKVPSECIVAHPRLGGLNAIEWFSLVEMHYHHHLLQKERLQHFIAGTV